MALNGYTKLASSLVTSSIWVESDSTLRVWIAMLALADQHGVVQGSVPGFARLCGMTIEEMEEALEKFSSPDPYSRDQEHEGRRIVRHDEPARGGWRLLNYEKFRETRDPVYRREYKRKWQADHRAKQADRESAKARAQREGAQAAQDLIRGRE